MIRDVDFEFEPPRVVKGARLDWVPTSKGGLLVTAGGYKGVVFATKWKGWSIMVIELLEDTWGEKVLRYKNGPFSSKEEAALAFEELYFAGKLWEIG
jgi:hypothetical protein